MKYPHVFSGSSSSRRPRSSFSPTSCTHEDRLTRHPLDAASTFYYHTPNTALACPHKTHPLDSLEQTNFFSTQPANQSPPKFRPCLPHTSYQRHSHDRRDALCASGTTILGSPANYVSYRQDRHALHSTAQNAPQAPTWRADCAASTCF